MSDPIYNTENKMEPRLAWLMFKTISTIHCKTKNKETNNYAILFESMAKNTNKQKIYKNILLTGKY